MRKNFLKTSSMQLLTATCLVLGLASKSSQAMEETDIGQWGDVYPLDEPTDFQFADLHFSLEQEREDSFSDHSSVIFWENEYGESLPDLNPDDFLLSPVIIPSLPLIALEETQPNQEKVPKEALENNKKNVAQPGKKRKRTEDEDQVDSTKKRKAPKKITEANIEEMVELKLGGVASEDIAEELGCSPFTVRKRLRGSRNQGDIEEEVDQF